MAYDPFLCQEIKLDYEKFPTINEMLKFLDRTVVDSKSTLRELSFCNFQTWELTDHFENYGCHLTTMMFFECTINPSELAKLLKHCPQLEELNLGYCEIVDSQFIEEIVKLKNLKRLSLPVSHPLDGNYCLERIMRECHRLEFFFLVSASTLNDSCILAFEDLNNVRYEHVEIEVDSSCFAITFRLARNEEPAIKKNSQICQNESLLILGKPVAKSIFTTKFGGLIRGFTNLTQITLQSCVYFDDEGLRVITDNCPAVLELSLYECSGLTDDGLTAIVRSCRLLQKLYIQTHPNITGRVILQNLSQFPDLVTLGFSGSVKVVIDDELAEDLSRKYPNLTILDGAGKSVNHKTTSQADDVCEKIKLIEI